MMRYLLTCARDLALLALLIMAVAVIALALALALVYGSLYVSSWLIFH